MFFGSWVRNREDDPKDAFPGQGKQEQEQEQEEIDQMRREVTELKAEQNF